MKTEADHLASLANSVNSLSGRQVLPAAHEFIFANWQILIDLAGGIKDFAASLDCAARAK